jgi:CheY-like chemotaxis protein
MTLTGHQETADILVVDDEKRIADTLALILRSKGYVVQAAYDGMQAYEICRTVIPRLLISDVVMPEMNGIELAIKVRAEDASLCGASLLRPGVYRGHAAGRKRTRFQFRIGRPSRCILKRSSKRFAT